MNRKKMYLLTAQEYEHDFDKKALKTLNGTIGLETLIKKFNEYGIERILRIQYTGSNLKITKNNYPKIYNILIEACENIGLKDKPDLYVEWGYSINGFTAGVEKPIIVLNSGAIDLLTPSELLCVIGHEIGHIKSKHVLYHQMASVLPDIGEFVGSFTLGIGEMVSKTIEIALLNWQRMSEFTADRAGLLACQDINVVLKLMVKMSGIPQRFFDKINTDEFITQAREFENYDYNTLDKLTKVMSIMWQSHPWTVMRASEILRWNDSGAYDKILNKY